MTIHNPIDLNAVSHRIGVPELAPYAMLNEKQLAELLGVSVSLLQKQRVAGTGIRFYRLGRACRYRAADIIDAIEKATYVSTSQTSASENQNFCPNGKKTL